MKITILALVGALLLGGCREQRESVNYEEQATVVGKNFYPAHDVTTTSYSYNPSTGGYEFQSDTEHVPDAWDVVFKCQHGQFTVGGENAQRLYPKLNVGETVYVLYKEVSYVNKDKKTGKETLEHADYRFLDAGHNSFEAQIERH